MNGSERFLAACSCRAVDRTPVWMMRQAGRYLPEYRALRERIDFSTLCRTPDLAAEVSLQPVVRFGVDACIIFSDILVVGEAMGVHVDFAAGGPRVESPVRTTSDVERLNAPDPDASLGFVLEALRSTRRALDGRAALIGFVGAPFTLAAYLAGGIDSRPPSDVKTMMYAQPSTLNALLVKLTSAVSAFAAAQIAAGAQAVQIFDTWAGELEPRAYEEFALPYQADVTKRVRECGVPAILYVNGCAGILELMARTEADVLSVDWRIDLGSVRARIGSKCAVQGNVDPHVLLSNADAVTAAARAAMASAGPVGHILNLGHGVLPATPLECAQAFVRAPESVGPSSP